MELEDLEVKIFKALAHPIRLKVIKKLREAKVLCVCQLNDDVEFSQSNLSQHLKILKDAGILVSEKEGLKINYRIKNEEVLNIIDHAERMVIQNIEKLRENIVCS